MKKIASEEKKIMKDKTVITYKKNGEMSIERVSVDNDEISKPVCISGNSIDKAELDEALEGFLSRTFKEALPKMNATHVTLEKGRLHEAYITYDNIRLFIADCIRLQGSGLFPPQSINIERIKVLDDKQAIRVEFKAK